MQSIFKILTREQWTRAQVDGYFAGSPDDIRDGFMHFSTAGQIAGTLQKHFANQIDLLLAEVNPDSLGDSLKWEPSRNDQLFPHLYCNLPLDAVSSIRKICQADREQANS